MNAPLIKGLAWAVALAALTALLFESLAYGFAHGNMLLVAVFFGVAAAASWELPGLTSLVGVFGYQLLYFVLLALVVLAVRGVVRVRRTRLSAVQEKPHGPSPP